MFGNMLEYILELCYMIGIENRIEKWPKLMVSQTKTIAQNSDTFFTVSPNFGDIGIKRASKAL